MLEKVPTEEELNKLMCDIERLLLIKKKPNRKYGAI